jgi:large subunit ribosomal protein L13
MNRTYSPRSSEIERNWFVVDATGQRLGTLASRVAQVLAGKHKPTYATHMDVGDHVIVLNASRIDIGRGKIDQKVYARHSGYPGGYREETLGHLLERRPEEVIRRAVKGMLPRTRLGAQQLRKLKIYAGAEHPHEAQVPAPLPNGKSSGFGQPSAEATSTPQEQPLEQSVAPVTPAAEAGETAAKTQSADVQRAAADGATADDNATAGDVAAYEDKATADTTTGGSDE